MLECFIHIHLWPQLFDYLDKLIILQLNDLCVCVCVLTGFFFFFVKSISSVQHNYHALPVTVAGEMKSNSSFNRTRGLQKLLQLKSPLLGSSEAFIPKYLRVRSRGWEAMINIQSAPHHYLQICLEYTALRSNEGRLHNVLECLSCIAKEQERRYLVYWIPSARGGIPWGIPPWEVNKVYGNRFMQVYSVQKSITCARFFLFCELLQSNTKGICYMEFMKF